MSQHTNSMFEFLAPGRGGRGGAAHHAAHAAAQEAARHHHAQQVSSRTIFLPLDFFLIQQHHGIKDDSSITSQLNVTSSSLVPFTVV